MDGEFVAPGSAPGDWDGLLVAADAAGRQAARMLAQRCGPWELGRTGRVWVALAPSPLATRLDSIGRTETATADEVHVPIVLGSAALAPQHNAAAKARSLLVREAYARAWASTLTQECGAFTSVYSTPDVDRLHADVVGVEPHAASPDELADTSEG